MSGLLPSPCTTLAICADITDDQLVCHVPNPAWTHRYLHAKHHEMKANLNVLTTGYMSILEGQVSAGVPMLALYAAGAATGNWWYCLAGDEEAALVFPALFPLLEEAVLLTSLS